MSCKIVPIISAIPISRIFLFLSRISELEKPAGSAGQRATEILWELETFAALKGRDAVPADSSAKRQLQVGRSPIFSRSLILDKEKERSLPEVQDNELRKSFWN